MEPKLITSMYSRVIGALVLGFLVALVLAWSMPSAMAYSGNATYIEYKSEEVFWEWNTVNCLALTEDNYTLEYRQRHWWTEFCGDLGPYTGSHGCHHCLQVTNSNTTQGDVSVTVRIIEICSKLDENDPVVRMDEDAFTLIDPDNQRDANNQLMVNYNIDDCGDEDEE